MHERRLEIGLVLLLGGLYWYFWVIVIAVEAIAGAAILKDWLFPNVSLWALNLILMVVLTITNLFSVKSFGEFEYWFSLIKIVAIVLFLALGGAYRFRSITWYNNGLL